MTKAKSGKRGTGSIYKQRGCATYTIQWYKSNKCYREATGTSDFNEARRKLTFRLNQVNEGTFLNIKTERVKVNELAQLVFNDYVNLERKSLDDVQGRWKLHVGPFFAHLRAVQITYPLVEEYKAKRKQAGVTSSTINRELAFLKRAFKLGYDAKLVVQVPCIKMLKESDPRTGFLEDAQYSQLAAECNKEGLWLRAMFEVGCAFGWRISELQDLRVRRVDLAARTMRLEPGETKNNEARTAVMPSLVYSLIAQCVANKNPDNFVFSRKNDGKRIGDFRTSWYKACCAAGVGRMICRTCEQTVVGWTECPQCKTGIGGLRYSGLIFHDLRRTAVRNMTRRGIVETVAMKISGHKTRSVFERYNIVSDGDLRDAAARMERAIPTFNHDVQQEQGFEQAGSGSAQLERPN